MTRSIRAIVNGPAACAAVALLISGNEGFAQVIPKPCLEFPPTADSVHVLIQSVLRPADKSKSINALDADEILRAISANLSLPANLALPIFVGTEDYPGQQVRTVFAWPQFTGNIRFILLPGGKFRKVAPSVRSMSPKIELAMLNAVRATDASGALEQMFIPEDGFSLDYALAANELADSLSLVLRKARFPAYKVDHTIQVLRGNPVPDYPFVARKNGAEGSATFAFVVGERGSIVPGTVILLEGTYKQLNQAVIDVLPKYRHIPAVAAGCPVNSWARQKFEFKFDTKY